MRLLIYGGNSYRERRKVGDWPAVPAGALGDIYGLTSEVPAYGLGILDDSPFLVFRRLNDVPGQRLYAFTLLLDPGREMWRKFGWNAAALASVLFGGDDSLGNGLLRSPEEADLTALSESLKKLAAPHLPQRDTADSLRDLWAGATAAGGLVAAACEEIGFGSRPAPFELAARLDTLPPCFRTAGGWLMGGSKEHAQAFGANLLLDARVEEAPRTFAECVAAGRSVIKAWDGVKRSPKYGKLLEDLHEAPVWEWGGVIKGASPERVLKGINLLATVIPIGQCPEEVIGVVEKYADGGAPFAEEILSAVRSRVMEGEGVRSPSVTRFILSQYFGGLTRLQPDFGLLLNPEVTADEFVRRNLSPEPAATNLTLPLETRLLTWRGLALKAATVQASVALLGDAWADLSREPTEDDPGPATRLVRDVFRVRATEGDLKQWLPLAEQAGQGVLDELLCAEARARVASRHESWSKDYVLTGDNDGAFLATLNFRPTELHNLVVAIIHAATMKGEDYWLEWLRRVASSPLRERLTLDTKFEIVNHTPRDWEDLLLLYGMYLGTAEPTLKPPRDAALRSALLGELACMARERRTGGKVPQLLGIVKALGQLSGEAAEELKSLKPALNFQTASRWIQGWRDMGDDDFAAAEARRLLTHSDNPLPDSFTLGEYALGKEERLSPLFVELIFGGPTDRDIRYRTRLKELLGRNQHPELLQNSLRGAVAGVIKVSRDTTVFARRFGEKRELLDLLFSRLAPDQSVWLMAAVARNEPEKFEIDAFNFCTSLLPGARGHVGDELVNFGRAFCSFLLSPEWGSHNRRRLSSDLQLTEEWELDEALWNYLAEHGGDAMQPTHGAEKDGEEAVPPPKPTDVRDEPRGETNSPPPNRWTPVKLLRILSTTSKKFSKWLQEDSLPRLPADESRDGAPADGEADGVPEAAPADQPPNDGRTADP